MKSMKLIVAAAAASLALAVPQGAMAQSEWPVVPNGHVEIGMISVDDGHSLDYANYLADGYRKSQDFAKAQGWIKDYQIWVNANPRKGEPDIWLVTWFDEFADAEESERRSKAFMDHMKKTEKQLQAESGQRATYRHQDGSMLFNVVKWRN